MMLEDDVRWMREALAEAQVAAERGEVPIGAVLVQDNREIARAYNRTITDCDPTAHAEMIALRLGAQAMRNYRLANTTLYLTIEACVMCARALIETRVPPAVFGGSA